MFRASLKKALVLGGLLLSARAMAEPDTFFLGQGLIPQGTGTDYVVPDGTPAGSPFIVNSYAQLKGVRSNAAGRVLVDVDEASPTGEAAFSGGELVLVLQMGGATSAVVGAQTDFIFSSTTRVGRWELARVQSVAQGATVNDPDTLTLTAPLVQEFDADVTQVVRVPEYKNVRIDSGRGITAPAWDGKKGGVVAFLATGTVTNNGTIDVSGKGFQGGPFVAQTSNSEGCTEIDTATPAAAARKGEGVDPTRFNASHLGRGNIVNGGGGGVCMQSGGGGGGNGGRGGVGGNSDNGRDGSRPVGGLGGVRFSDPSFNAASQPFFGGLTFGGGGGSGHGAVNGAGASGAPGGGIIFIRANQLAGTGTIKASGNSPSGSGSEGGAGGGAGGSIWLRFAGSATCDTGDIEAKGGTGGSSGENIRAPGGGGGGGRIILQSQQGGTATCSLDTGAVAAGLAGTDPRGGSNHNGATPTAQAAEHAGVMRTVTMGFRRVAEPTVTVLAHTRGEGAFISGTAGDPADVVVVYIDGVEVGRPPPDASRAYTFDPNPELPEGMREVTVAATFMGAWSPRSAPQAFSVDRTNPVVTVPADSGPAEGTTVSATTATFNFTVVESNLSTVQCLLNGASRDCRGSTSITYEALPEGLHTFQVVATDQAGNSGSSVSRRWTVDSRPPNLPGITAPANGAYVNSRPGTNTFTGTAEAGGDIIEVFIDGAKVGEVTAVASGASGAWTFDPATANPPIVQNIPHWLQVRARDLAGNLSAFAPGRIFILDTAVPAVPAVTSLGNGGTTRQNPPRIAGVTSVASAGSTVRLYLNGSSTPVSVIADANGDWVYVPSTRLDDPRTHTLQMEAEDAAGNVSARSGPFTFTVDSGAPPRPTVDPISANGYTQDRTPTLEGGAEANSFVTVYLDGVPQSEVQATAGGRWSFTPSANLDENRPYTVRVSARDAAGNVSELSDPRVFIVDDTNPETPTITYPLHNSFIPTEAPIYRGTAEAGTAVEIRVNNNLIGTVVASAGGLWSFVSVQSLSENVAHTVVVTSRDEARNTAESVLTTFTVDKTPPDTGIPVHPDAVTRSTSANFSFSSTEQDVTYECRLNNADGFSACPTPPNFTVADNATHTLLVRAKDRAGNVDPTPASFTWEVDNTPPGPPTLTAPADDAVLPTLTPVISGTAPAGTTVRVVLILDDVTLPVSESIPVGSSGLWAYTTPSLVEQVVYRVTAFTVDGVGIESTTRPALRRFSVDVRAPDTSIDNGPGDASGAVVAETQATFDFSSSPEQGVTYECSLNGATPFTICTDPVTFTVAPDDRHTLLVRAKDRAGNVDPTPAGYTWTVDQTPPETTIVSGPPSITNSQTASFEFSSTEPESTFECRLDSTSGAFTACPGNRTFTGLGHGPHTLDVRARDPRGNVDATHATHNWTVDIEPPNTAFVSVPPVLSSSFPSIFTFRSIPSGNTFQCSLDGQAFGACPAPPAGTELPDGAEAATGYSGIAEKTPHTLLVRAVDAAGNADPTPVSHIWTVDVGGVSVRIIERPPRYTNSVNSLFRFTSNRTNVAYLCALNPATIPPSEGDFAPCPAYFDPQGDPNTPVPNAAYFTNLAEREHRVIVVAEDGSGQRSSPPDDHIWTVDLRAPGVPEVETPRVEWVNTARPLISGTAEENASVEVYLYPSAGAEPVRPTATVVASGTGGQWTYVPADLVPQAYSVRVLARDAANNRSALSPVVGFTVDIEAPTISVTTELPAKTNQTTATFNLSALEYVTFQCRLDTGAFEVCGEGTTATWTRDNLSSATHRVSVRATDRAGNPTLGTEDFLWEVDTNRPDTIIVEGPKRLTGDRFASFMFRSTESGVRYECKLDDQDYAPCGEAPTFTGLTPRKEPHVLLVRARDAADNEDLTPASYEWTVDGEPPAPPQILSPAEGALLNSRQVEVSGTAEPGAVVTIFLNQNPVGTRTVGDNQQWSFVIDTVGRDEFHTVAAHATDGANNTGERSAARSFAVDTDKPDTTIGDTKPQARERSTSATFTYSSNDPEAVFECSLDNAPYRDCPADGTFSGLEEGTHSLGVRAVDRAGNQDPTPALHSWRVYLGSDVRTRGGGLSCATTAGEGPSLALLGLGGLALLAARRRRR
jgi:MYXO-CTERM domain-containing protein